jgi:TP901 family phage tail tape measure protein
MANEFPVKITLKAIDQFSSVVKSLTTGALTDLDGKMRSIENSFKLRRDALGNWKKRGEALKDVGEGMTKFVTLPALAAGAAALKVGDDFDKAFKHTQLVTGAAGEELQSLRQGAIATGQDSKYSAAEVASGMTEMSKAGLSVSEILGNLANVTSFATASNLDFSKAAALSGDVLEGYRMKSSELGRVQDVLSNVYRRTGVEMGEMGEAFRVASPISNALGVSFEETAAALGIMADKGLKGSEAGQALKMMLLSITDPASEAKETLTKLGIAKKDVFEKSGQFKGISNLLGLLEKAGAKEKDYLEIFGKAGLSNEMPLFKEGSKALSELNAKLENSVGATKEMAAVMDTGLSSSLQNVKAALQAVSLSISETGLFEDVAAGMKKVAGVIQEFSKANPKLFKTAVVFGAIAAALGPIIVAVGALVAFVPSLVAGLSVIGGIITAPVVATLAAFVAGWIAVARISALVRAEWSNIANWYETMVEGFRKLDFGLLKTAFLDLAGVIGNIFKALWEVIWDDLIIGLKDAITSMSFGGALSKIGGLFGLGGGQPTGEPRSVTPGMTGGPLREQRSHVQIDFANMPPGTSVKAKSESEMLGINLGLQGALGVTR